MQYWPRGGVEPNTRSKAPQAFTCRRTNTVGRLVDRHTDGQTGRQTGKHTDSWADRQANRWTGWQTGATLRLGAKPPLDFRLSAKPWAAPQDIVGRQGKGRKQLRAPRSRAPPHAWLLPQPALCLSVRHWELGPGGRTLPTLTRMAGSSSGPLPQVGSGHQVSAWVSHAGQCRDASLGWMRCSWGHSRPASRCSSHHARFSAALVQRRSTENPGWLTLGVTWGLQGLCPQVPQIGLGTSLNSCG